MKTINFAHEAYQAKPNPLFKLCFFGLTAVALVSVGVAHHIIGLQVIEVNKEITHLQAKMASRTTAHAQASQPNKKALIYSSTLEFLFHLPVKNNVLVERLEMSKNKNELTCASTKASNLVVLSQTIGNSSPIKHCRLESLCKKNNRYVAHYTFR